MKENKYNVKEYKTGIIVENIRDFNPIHTFECGQCFRWTRQEDESFTGVVKDKMVNIKMKDNAMIISNANTDDFYAIWHEYLDLGRDYSKIKAELANKDDVMRKAVEFGHGIRLLKQDFWETLISFIISANNRIPMIKKVVENISRKYGKILEPENLKYHSFPSAIELSLAQIEDLEGCKTGYRSKYIFLTTQAWINKVVDIDMLGGMETKEARKALMNFPGVGAKVADCVLLFTGTKYNVFPKDVWVKRVMEELYFKREASLNEIENFSEEYFGDLKGFAQQYLFYYARENRIGFS